jgi:hypothetical protein
MISGVRCTIMTLLILAIESIPHLVGFTVHSWEDYVMISHGEAGEATRTSYGLLPISVIFWRQFFGHRDAATHQIFPKILLLPLFLLHLSVFTT